MNILSLDIGGSKLVCGVVTGEGKVLAAEKTLLPKAYTADGLSSIILPAARRLCKEYGCSAAGAAIPGLADARAGVWVYAPYSGIKDYHIASIVSERCGVPVFIENDVNVCAVGERRFGAAKSMSDFIWVTVSNGIGGALCLGGRLYTGSAGNAGELGHVKVVEGEAARLCGCGARGCLEAEAAGPAISAKFELRTGRALSAKAIADEAKAGNADAEAVYTEAGYLIGKALASAANIINPTAAVLGGGVATDFALLRGGLQSALERYLFRAANQSFSVVPTALGYSAALIGAAAWAYENTNKI